MHIALVVNFNDALCSLVNLGKFDDSLSLMFSQFTLMPSTSCSDNFDDVRDEVILVLHCVV